MSPPPLVLAYHGVGHVPLDRDPDRLVVRPHELRRQIRALRRWGYALVPFGTFATRLDQAGPRGVTGLASLTFDDGFADNLTDLAPLLEELEAPATVFAVPGLAGAPHPEMPSERLLTADELVELAGRGVEIGAHSYRHADLTTLSEPEVRDDLVRCRESLEELLGRRVDLLAYPYGRHDERVRRAAAAAGYRAAVGTSGGSDWSDPMCVPRQDVNTGSSLVGLRLKRSDRYERIVATLPGRAARRIAWVARRWRW